MWEIREGDALGLLREMPEASVQCCVTSPPYWGLRDYGTDGQLGLEPTPEQYVENLVNVFREVKRVLRDDGTLWLNLGDSYTSGGRDYRDPGKSEMNGGGRVAGLTNKGMRPDTPAGLKAKDLVGIPWRVAFALQADGWWLRSDIIWSKPNPMPESVRDRPTKAHEYLFLLTKSARYYYDQEAIAEPSIHAGAVVKNASDRIDSMNGSEGKIREGFKGEVLVAETRNARSVWTIATTPFTEAHFATFPPEMPRRCIAAGTKPGDLVLDPFAGAGTTILVADRMGRRAIGLELNPTYAAMARRRITSEAPLFSQEERSR